MIHKKIERHFATVWEYVADKQNDKTAIICNDAKISWKEYDDRSARLANFLKHNGVNKNTKIGLYLHNNLEYLEAQYATFKLECVPINVNYRYKAAELIYLLDNCDAEVVFFQSTYKDEISQIINDLPNIKLWIQVNENDTEIHENAIDYNACIQDFNPIARKNRDERNLYMIYTGGTTGMPKGVMYEHCDFMQAIFGVLKGLDFEVPDTRETFDTAELDHLIETTNNNRVKTLVACPFMHGTGMWLGAFLTHLTGGLVLAIPELGFDPKKVLKAAQDNDITNIVIVGDAFAKPIANELDFAKENGVPYKLDKLNLLISSGVIFSSETKEALLKHCDIRILDLMGSSEGGMGSSVSSRSESIKTAKFKLNPDVIVVSDNGELVEPGSGERGMIGTGGLVPLGYYKDPEKSAKTFKEFQGKRYSFPGDYALVEEDGSITLLGRGSNCINSAGEKIYPEEVEEAIKKNNAIYDCLVVGVDDEKFGQKVVAIASVNENQSIDEAELINNTREHISGYKLPKKVIFVANVERAPNGKANYKWAKEIAQANEV